MSIHIVKCRKTYLKSPLGVNATSCVLKELVDTQGNPIEMTSFGEWGVIVVKSGDSIEMIKFDDITQNVNGSATITFATNGRNLSPVFPHAGSASGATPFITTAEVIVTNDPLTMQSFANQENENTWKELQTFEVIPILPNANPTTDNQATRKKYADELDATNVHKTGDESVAGIKTFASSPIVPTPTTDMQVANRKYVNDTAYNGAPDASETTKGIVEMATFEDVGKGETVGSTGAVLVMGVDKFPNSETYECAEDIDAGDTVALSVVGWDTGNLITQSNSAGTAKDLLGAGTTWYAQEILVPAGAKKLASIKIKITSLVGNYYYVKVKSSLSGGIDLYGTQIAEANSAVERTFDTGNVDISPYAGGSIFIVVSVQSGAGAGNKIHISNSDLYAGNTYLATSENGTYVLESGYDFFFEANYSVGEANQLLKASSASFNERIGFIGFAMETKLATEECKVNISNYAEISGLVAGTDYYLSDVNGEIRVLEPDQPLIDFQVDNTRKAYNNTNWYAQAFTTSADVDRIKTITVKSGDAPTSNQEIWSIRSSLTGADLWSVTMNTTNGVDVKTLTPNLTVSPNTTYYLVVRSNGYTLDLAVDNTATYGTVHSSVDSGANWTTDSGYRWFINVVETTDPTNIRWVGRARSTTVLDRMLYGRKRKVSPWKSISGSFVAPCQMQIQMAHQGSISVDGVSIASGTDQDATPYIEKGDTVNLSSGKYIILQ